MSARYTLGLFSILLLVLVLGCAGPKETKKPEKVLPADKMDESFDPLSLDDEDIKFEPVDNSELMKDDEDNQGISLPSGSAGMELKNELVTGFRIQILSTKDLENATKAKGIAEEQFGDLGERFYLDFDSPYYKVRMGDFKSRQEANRVREVVQSRGYPKAWIVPSQVWSNPPSTLSADSLDITTPEN